MIISTKKKVKLFFSLTFFLLDFVKDVIKSCTSDGSGRVKKKIRDKVIAEAFLSSTIENELLFNNQYLFSGTIELEIKDLY